MSLGVLNNLNAIYAENNLNNTSSSLSTVLRQLSSGSKINSGADDAAGLSMVDGLQANRQALTQSVTNAAEGVGLLQVADGALTQVTSLLNRAVTLATEASNGTLNSSQDTAANQEYQSILSEISNIGSTTTYNDTAVFGAGTTNIYTGDSSTAGSAIDALNIRSLSSSNVGDTGGVMAYSNGQNNVFINLSKTSGTTVTNAQATDTLNQSGTTTINVNYLVKGANATETTATTSISVGTGTSFANTANGLMSAINSAGLGLSASFATQSQAGVTGGGTQTGIQITGGLVSAGVDPGTASTSGILNPNGISGQNLTQGQVFTVQVGGSTAFTTTINSSTANLTSLANAINTSGNAGGPNAYVTASIITNGNGSQSLSLADNSNSEGALAVSITPPTTTGNTLTTGTMTSVNPVTMTVGAQTPGKAGSDATVTLGLGGSGTSSATDVLTGTISLSNTAAGTAASGIVFKMGSGSASGSSAGSLANGTFTVNGNTLGNLATAIAYQLGNGATASVGATGITITSGTAGTTLQQVGSSTLSSTPALTASSNVNGATATNGTDGSTTIAMNGGNSQFTGGDGLTGKIVLTNGTTATPGTPMTFVMGSVAGGNGSSGNPFTTAASTVNGLVAAINANTGADGMTASLSGGKIVLTANATDTTIAVSSTAGSNTLAETSDALAATSTANVAGVSPASINLATGGTMNATGDQITGSIVMASSTGGGSITYSVGGAIASDTATHYYTGSTTAEQTLSGLAAAISLANTTPAGGGVATGLTATASSTGINIVQGDNTNTITQSVNTLADLADAAVVTSTASQQTPASASSGAKVGTGVADINGNQVAGTGDTLTGSIVLSNGGTNYTFGTANSGLTAGVDKYVAADNSLGALETAINAHDAATGVTAALNSNGTGLNFTTATTGTSIGVNSSTLTDASKLSFTTPPNGSTDTGQNLAGVIALTDGGNLTGASASVSGTVTVTNGTGANAVTDTFVMGAASQTSSNGTFSLTSTSMADLVTAINNEGHDTTSGGIHNLNLTASVDAATGGIFVQSTQAGATGLAANTTNLTVSLNETSANGTNGAAGYPYTAATVNYSNTGTSSTTNLGTDQVAGSIVLKNVANAGAGTNYGIETGNTNGEVTFHVGGNVSNDSATDIYTGTDTTLQGLATAITNAGKSVVAGGLGLNISASVGANGGGLTVTSTDVGNGTSTAGSALTSVSSNLVDQYGAVQGTQTGGTGPLGATVASATIGTKGQISSTDQLAGTIVLQNGNSTTPGTAQTFVMGSASAVSGATVTTGGLTLQDLASAINGDTGLGLNASVTNGVLNLQASATDTSITVGGGPTNLYDTVTENVQAPATGIIAAASTATMSMASGPMSGSDIMTGSVAISANGANSGNAITFVMGSSSASGSSVGALSQNGNTFTVNGNTLGDLQTAVQSELNVNVGISGITSNSLTLTSSVDNSTAINITSASGSLQDAGTGATTSTSSLGSFASMSDKVSGTVDFNLEGTPGTPVSFTIAAGTTVQGLVNEINTGSTTANGSTDPNHVHATATQNATTGFYSITLTSDVYGTAGEIQNTGGTSVIDQAPTTSLSFNNTAAYNVGLSSTSLYDSSSGQSATSQASIVANTAKSAGIATISYSDGAGQSLSATDLSNQTDAQTALTGLNSAITDVAAQDGYIGAQINTLNAVSQVLTTQQENVESAQNAVQATDYASATSNMSKYEILSQTGIAALAQANSIQQEVTKLLQ